MRLVAEHFLLPSPISVRQFTVQRSYVTDSLFVCLASGALLVTGASSAAATNETPGNLASGFSVRSSASARVARKNPAAPKATTADNSAIRARRRIARFLIVSRVFDVPAQSIS